MIRRFIRLWTYGVFPRDSTETPISTQPYDRAYVDGKLPLPDPAYIKALTRLVGMETIVLTGDEATLAA